MPIALPLTHFIFTATLDLRSKTTSQRHISVNWTLGKYFNLSTPWYKIAGEHYSELSALLGAEDNALGKSHRDTIPAPGFLGSSRGDGHLSFDHKNST